LEGPCGKRGKVPVSTGAAQKGVSVGATGGMEGGTARGLGTAGEVPQQSPRNEEKGEMGKEVSKRVGGVGKGFFKGRSLQRGSNTKKEEEPKLC